jgi:CHAT domain-containing protein
VRNRERDLGVEVQRQNMDSSPDGAGARLYSLLFDPTIGSLGEHEHLLLAPDGDLAKVPFEVLPVGTGRLIDIHHISYLTTGRDLLRAGSPPSGQQGEPVVLADPDFDVRGDVAGKLEGKDVGPLRGGLDYGRLHFRRLPGTEQEGKQVAAMLGVRPWLAEAALEGRLKACRSPRILHLATHGFFLENQKHDPTRAVFGLFGPEGLSGRLTGPLPENPLLRSGMGLAGVNTWLAGGSPPAEAEDGILTAEDVTGLDLLDTELVVLSACETGLGEVRVGEGVFGLRRAFVLAGARTLVMSLWKVPDEQTRELMEEFYRRLLAGAPRADALREAQLVIRAKHPHPYFWGAFICQGDPGPLSK